MSRSEVAFAALLTVAFGLVVAGVTWFSVGLGLITSGVLLTAWGYLLLGGDSPVGPSDEVTIDVADLDE